MKRFQAFKYELQSNDEQQRQMRRFAGSCRYVFNKALALQQARYEHGEKKLGYAGLCKRLTEWRNSTETAWLSDAPVHPLQQSLKDLERAYTNFFAKRADFPRFKKKGLGDSFRYPDATQFKIDQANSRLFLPKLGWLRYCNSRNIIGQAKNITVSANGGKWFVSIQTEREVAPPITQATSAIGIDLGVARFATMSDGSYVAPLHSFRIHQQALTKAQRDMSRKEKFSRNWKKAKARVHRIYARMAHVRHDFLHKTSTTISKNHAMVVLEDLQVRNMSTSAAGTVETPGKNVRAKSGLNRAILDQGWGEFRRQLDYKLSWNGGMLLAVPAHHTSQTCPACRHISKENRRTQARFLCVQCGYENHADLVGALNILARGMALVRGDGPDTTDASVGQITAAQIACEVNGARARQQQEPTEATTQGVALV